MDLSDDSPPSGSDAAAELYDEQYYANYHSGYENHPYRKGDPVWEQFFGGVADEIVRTLAPRRAFDAGCAIGFLVEALWDRGVEAHGRDISEFAIGQVRPDVRDYCDVGSLADPIDGSYDLVVCIEVLEHLEPAAADEAIGRLTSIADRILFSSTPTDFDEVTHVNVRSPIYWLRRFADRGFRPVLGYDATFLTAHAVLFERSDAPVPDDVLLGAAQLSALRMHLKQSREEVVRLDRSLRKSLVVSPELEGKYAAVVRELQAERSGAEAARRELQTLQSTKVIRYSRLLRRIYGRLRQARMHRELPVVGVATHADGTYGLWIRDFDTLGEDVRTRIAARVASLVDPPLVSVVIPVFDPPETYLRRAIESVRAQIYPHWELCLVDDASTAAWVPKILEEYRASDDRIKLIRRETNGHISAASNSGVDAAAGEWIALLDHDDELAEHALALAVLELEDHPQAALLYSDEDKIDEHGHRSAPFFKPDFDPLLLLSQNYLCHMTMIRRELVTVVGGFREGLEGSQDWDLVLRATERLGPAQVVHVPHVLYHWRIHSGSTATGVAAKPYAVRAGERAVSDHLERTPQEGDVITNPVTGVVRVKWRLPERHPKVSIVIPTRDGRYLGRCLDSLLRTTEYPDYEIVVVDNGSEKPETFATLAGHPSVVQVVRDDRPFNYSALNNEAVRHCTGEVLCLLNDDCEVTHADWLTEMVGQLLRDGVGAVGAKLLYPDGRIQHAGVVLGVGGVAGHAHRLADRLAFGHFGWLFTPRSLSAVTAACMVVRREVFDKLGGLDETNLAIAFNDVDFCLRVREAGWRVVWTPFAVLTHHESVSRGHDVVVRPEEFAKEIGYMQERWGPLLRQDPAYNPNLSLRSEQFDLAFPPRTTY